MNWSKQLLKELRNVMGQPTCLASPAAYRYFLDEQIIFTSEHGYEQIAEGELTLIWEDGSVSIHEIAPSALDSLSLPIDSWRSQRFFCHHRRYFAKSSGSLPTVSLCDQALYQTLQKTHNFTPPSGFRFRLAGQTRTAAHSKGLYLQEKLTDVCLLASVPDFPFTYRSRRLPDAKEIAYLQAELDWFLKSKPSRSSRLSVESGTSILFSPDAVSQLFSKGLLPHLSQTDSLQSNEQIDLLPLLKKTTLSIRYDPSVPWSPGSHRFCQEGSPARSLSLDRLKARRQKIDPLEEKAIHWSHKKVVRLREWLAVQKQVLLIPSVFVPELFSPFHPEIAWVPHACLFVNGRPVATGPTFLPFSLRNLLTSPDLVVIGKVGWDRFGVALSSSYLVATS